MGVIWEYKIIADSSRIAKQS